MKAVIYKKYGSPDVLRLVEIDKPVPSDNEVLIKIHASMVSAVDCIFRGGKSFFARLATGPIRPKMKILGADFAGEIVSVGKGVKQYKKGDRVFGESGNGYGAYAEYICLKEDAPMTPIPPDMPYDLAAAIPYGALTALPFLRDNGLIKSGQKVLINGAAGSVGTAAVQFAKYFGAEVAAVCGTRNMKLVKSLGADKVIDYTKEDFAEGGETYDIIFDTVGKTIYSHSKKALKANGRFLVTVISIKILFQMLWTSRMSCKKAIIAFTGLRPLKDKLKDLNIIRELFETGKIKPVIDRHYQLDQIAEAHRYDPRIIWWWGNEPC